MVYREIELEKINPPQVVLRAEIPEEDIRLLAESIRENGLINPITVRPVDGGDRYEVIAGHRRYLACKMINLEKVPCMVIEADDERDLKLKLAENVARLNLSPVEEAAAVETLMKEYSLGIKTVAKIMGKSEQWVRDRIKILEMPPDLQLALHLGQVNVAQAKVLSEIEDEDTRKRFTQEAAERGITARTLRMWVDALVYPHKKKGEDEEDWEEIERSIEETEVVRLMKCMVCRQPVEMHRTRTILVCFDCLEALREASREFGSGTFGATGGNGDVATSTDHATEGEGGKD